MYMIIGAGKCGTGLLADFWKTRTEGKKSFFCTPVVINTAAPDFAYARKKGILEDRWLGLCRPKPSEDDKRRVLRGTDPLFGSKIVGGMGKRFKWGYEAAEEAKEELKEMLPQMMPLRGRTMGTAEQVRQEIELAIMFFGLGGGTGSGCAPVVSQIFRELGIPIFAVGVLPHTNEGDDYANNAHYSMGETIKHANALILADNELINREGGAAKYYKGFNKFISGCVVDLFLRHLACGEKSKPLDRPMIDHRDFVNATTLSAQKKGVAIIGRATVNVKDLDSHGQNLRDVLVERAFYQMSVPKPEISKGEKVYFQFTYHPSLDKRDFPCDKITKEMKQQTTRDSVFSGFNTTSLRIAKLAFAQVYRPQDIERIVAIKNQARQAEKIGKQAEEDIEDFWEN